MAPRPPAKMDYWAVRHPVIYSLCVGGGWGLFVGIFMSIGGALLSWDNGSVISKLIFFTVFGAVSFGPLMRWITVRQVRKWEATDSVARPS